MSIKYNVMIQKSFYYNIRGGSMSSKYPVLPPDKIIEVMKKFGFYKILQNGSHTKYKKEETGKILLFQCIVN